MLFAQVCGESALLLLFVSRDPCHCSSPTGEKGVGRSGKPLHYKGSKFHRIIPGFMLQGVQ